MKLKALFTSILMGGIGYLTSWLSKPPTPANMVHHALRAVTLIRSAGRGGVTEGSGFFVSDHLVVTSYHVIEGLRSIGVETYDGRRYRVLKVVAANPHKDFAVLKIGGMAPLALKPAGREHVGDEVFTLGAPMGMPDSVSNGIVSQLRRGPSGEPLIQHTAPISPGSSGGPLLDAYGNVLGLNNFSVGEGQNVNFALDIGVVLLGIGKRPRRPHGLLGGAYNLIDHVTSRIGADTDWQESTRWQYLLRKDGDSERRRIGTR